MKQISSLLLVIIATLLLPVGCIDYEPVPYEQTVLPGTPFKRTVLVYMAAARQRASTDVFRRQQSSAFV